MADRVVQAALKLVLEPVFEADFLPVSYGFRPKRRAQDAIAEIHYFWSVATSRPFGSGTPIVVVSLAGVWRSPGPGWVRLLGVAGLGRCGG